MKPTRQISQPIDPITVASNYFSIDCLQLTFQLLRANYPSLAMTVQSLQAQARHDFSNNTQDKLLEIDLEVKQVSEIVAALADIANMAAEHNDSDGEQLIAIHQSLLDWLLYAQHFLSDNNLKA
ncbi:MAG: hypothetical protein ACJAYG_002566 [Oceanicoccus sp.]|jgi:hypothetical protein